MPRPTTEILSALGVAAPARLLLMGLVGSSCAQALGDYSVAEVGAVREVEAPLEPDASAAREPEPQPSEPALGGCFPQEVRCAGRGLQQCSEDRQSWLLLAACESPGHCDAALQTCTPQSCSAGSFSCSEGQLLTCTQDGWQAVRNCGNQALCTQGLRACEQRGDCSVAGACAQASCDEGDVFCVGATLQVCNETRSGLDVLQACVNASLCDSDTGRCLPPACEVDELRCSDNNVLLRCNPTRTGFTTAEVCTRGAVCSDAPGDERCVPPNCEPFSYSCDGTRLQRCSPEGNALETAEVCATPAQCNAAAGRCDLSINPADAGQGG